MRDLDAFGEPIDVTSLFRPERTALLDVLRGLTDGEWLRPTACPGWSVHDISLHLLGDDLRGLATGRDRQGARGLGGTATLDELVPVLDAQNEAWVGGARMLSPRLTIELLEWLAEPTERYLSELPPNGRGIPVSWVAPAPAPNWMHVAREYTERWVHQQQIRDAVGKPGLTERRFLTPVIDAFLRALPRTLPTEGYADGTVVHVRVGDPLDRTWAARLAGGRWSLSEPSDRPDATVLIAPDPLWRRAVRMMGREHVKAHAQLKGDQRLAAAVLEIRSAIVAA